MQDRRLRAEGVPSYTNAPHRWSVGLLPTCKETSHGQIYHSVRWFGRSQRQHRHRCADPGRDGEVRHVGSIGGDLAALNKALRKLISKGCTLHVCNFGWAISVGRRASASTSYPQCSKCSQITLPMPLLVPVTSAAPRTLTPPPLSPIFAPLVDPVLRPMFRLPAPGPARATGCRCLVESSTAGRSARSLWAAADPGCTGIAGRSGRRRA